MTTSDDGDGDKHEHEHEHEQGHEHGRSETVARALAGAIEARYGERLSGEDLEKITSDLVNLVKAGETLRAYPLSNADEPSVDFRPYRREC